MEKRNTDYQTIHIAPAILFVLLCTAACYGILFLPLPRQLGLTFRNTLYVFPVVFLSALGYGMTKNRYLRVVLMCVLFAFVLLPYSGLLNSGLSDQYALGGIIPWSDAFTMQLNTQRFLYGGQMGQSAAIRPLSLIFYGIFLHCFDNNYFALQVFLSVTIAICLIFTMDEVNRNFGIVCGAFFFTILFYYIRQRIGTFMTEPFGFICGLLSSRWLLKGIRTGKQRWILSGFLMLSIGMNARPAAMFLFPALGLWYFFIFLRDNSKRVLLGVLALILMLAGFGMNRVSQRYVYGDKSIPNRQAAEMVYGLCLGGKSWGDVVASPEMVALHDSKNVIADVVSLCAPVLRDHPENIVSALKVIFAESLVKSEYYGAFSFVNGNPKGLQTIVRYGLMLIWLIGFSILIRRRKNTAHSMLLVCVLGIVISECAAVPFSTNYLRLYAVSMWVPACAAGLFPQYLFDLIPKIQKYKKPSELPGPGREIISEILGFVILIISMFGAKFIKEHPLYRPAALSGVCAQDEEMLVTSVDSGSFIYLKEKPELSVEHAPDFRLPFVRQHIHDTASIEMFPFTDSIEEPTAIIRGIDLVNYEDALIFAPLGLVEGKTGYVQFCGNFIEPPILRNDRFFIPTSVTIYKDGL